MSHRYMNRLCWDFLWLLFYKLVWAKMISHRPVDHIGCKDILQIHGVHSQAPAFPAYTGNTSFVRKGDAIASMLIGDEPIIGNLTQWTKITPDGVCFL